MMYSAADYQNAADVIRSRTDLPIQVGMVLGSGLNSLGDEVLNPVVIPYADIPGCPQSTVQGHAGQLVIGTLEGCPVVAQQGRTHFYEGYSAEQITFLIRVFIELGVQTLMLTNAAGGLNPAYQVGDVMLVNDHINLVGMAGNNPLRGAMDATDEPTRFVGLAHAYDRELRQQAWKAAMHAGITLREGVYACVSGPNFETPAEVRMLRIVGADAVGMSTVHEALVARQFGLHVLAMSGITNRAIASIDTVMETSHLEVLDAASVLVPRMSAILRGVLQSLNR